MKKKTTKNENSTNNSINNVNNNTNKKNNEKINVSVKNKTKKSKKSISSTKKISKKSIINNKSTREVNKVVLSNKEFGNKKVMYRKHFEMNDYLSPLVKNIDIKTDEKPFSRYKTEKEYQDSFDDIMKFAKSITESRKKAINYVFYHSNNTDGYVGAYVIWNYLTNGGKTQNLEITFRGIQSGNMENSSKMERFYEEIKGKNVAVVDLAMNEYGQDYLKRITNDFIVIDDHPKITTMNKYPENVFTGGNHGASAYTYKVFYPDEKVPKVNQYVDDDDAKLYLSYLPKSHEFNIAITVRVTKNDFFVRNKKLDKTYGGGFNALHDLFSRDNPNLLIVMGSYMRELQENFKYAIAKNAYFTKWLGFDVGILNYESSGLSKVVGRQIITDAQQAERPIDFSILWCYHHQKQQYRLQIMEDHVKGHKPKVVDLIHYIKKSGQCTYCVGEGGGSMFIADLFLKGDGPNAPPPIAGMLGQRLPPGNIERFRPNKTRVLKQFGNPTNAK
jgi:hypothetical protein